MPNYWLGIMAVAFAAAMALWIGLVFRADRQRPGPPQESSPHREVVGGTFQAREGGRQLIPDPETPLVPEAEVSVPAQAKPTATEQATEAMVPKTVPKQRDLPVPERAQAQADRP